MSETLIDSIQIIIGLTGLVLGGELLVRGAASLAALARISPLVIGITVVAFGTSAPELAVTVQAASAGSAELAVGNVIGSNIANVLLILGVAALVAPLAVQSRIVRIDVPVIILASLALWLLASDGALGVGDGALLFAALVIYLAWSVVSGRAETDEVQAQLSDAATLKQGSGAGRLVRHLVYVVVGMGLLIVSARLLVGGASDIARHFGISELVIGLTVLAVGTSLPELVASVVASLRGQRDIAVGNVVGSNLFNILGVLGVGAMVAPDGIPVSPEALRLDLPIMIATALVCLPLLFTGCRLSRVEGGLLLCYFLAYMAYVAMGATNASFTRSFEIAMLGFVIPLTLIAIGLSVYYAIRRRKPLSPLR